MYGYSCTLALVEKPGTAFLQLATPLMGVAAFFSDIVAGPCNLHADLNANEEGGGEEEGIMLVH